MLSFSHVFFGQQPTTIKTLVLLHQLQAFRSVWREDFFYVNLKMDRNLDFFSCSLVLIPIAVVVIYSLLRGGRPPALNIPDPDLDLTFAFDALHDEICIKLETLFKERFGEYYVLPDGLTFSAVGEHLYSPVETLEGLQDIFVNIFFQGGQSPYFLNALDFVLNWV